MSYVIVNNETNVIVSTNSKYSRGKDRYETERAAKAGATRLIKSGRLIPGTFTVYDITQMPRKTRMVTNLMTGKLVEEDVNTPWSCSVASESYWSN